MQPQTVAALLALNRQFYARFAGDFARTRRSWPPGFERILPYLQTASNVLDLGCGNARLLAFLGAKNWQGKYTGLDSSENLLVEARLNAQAHPQIPSRFIVSDLFADDWVQAMAGSFDSLVGLAVLHHIPGAQNRRRFLAQCAAQLAPGRRLIVSTWQFMTSERLRKRIAPWEAAGISENSVESGDYLIGWGEGAPGLRYCAFIDATALATMATEAGLICTETFFSDGHEGNLNLYGIFTAR
jgi:tRNA (uracil-5-)-methyltransferase TRM9